MTPHGNSQPDPRDNDPEKLAKLLEIELMQKRASWQQAKARHSTLRTMSFLFLFLVIVAAFIAIYYVMSSGGLPASSKGTPSSASP